MTGLAPTLAVYLAAALAEIGGCFAFWSWARSGASLWWRPCPSSNRLLLLLIVEANSFPASLLPCTALCLLREGNRVVAVVHV